MKKSHTHQYMFLFRGKTCDSGDLSPEEMQKQMREVYAWIDGLTKQGVMTAAQPLLPGGRMVSSKNGSVVSDGIAAESKESVGGYFIVNAASLEEAVDIARTSPVFDHGARLEVRQLGTLDCD